MAGRRKKAKPKDDGRFQQRSLQEYGVSSSSSANTRPRHAPSNRTQAGPARGTPRSPLTSPTQTSAGTNKGNHQPSFTATIPAQDLVTTKEESLHELQQIQGEFELHRRIKELEGDVARLAEENHLLKEEVKAKTNQSSEAQALVEGMCCEIEKLKSQLEESKSQYENQNKEMAEMRKGISKQVREVEILRRLLEASGSGSLVRP